MARSARPQPPNPDPTEQLSYWDVSRRPLQMLIFLLPLILFYELALARLLQSDGKVLTNEAHKTLLQFFDAVGFSHSSTLVLGGIVIGVVLLLWHLLLRDPWTIDWPAIGLMAVEVLILTIPLLVLSRIIVETPAVHSGWLAMLRGSNGDIAQLGFLSGVAISVGAGLYEELVFRMLLIAALHTLLVDVGKLPHLLGAGIAIIVSAAAFTWYHPLEAAGGGISTYRLTFFFVAGLYFGLIYVLRGFGIVVGVHAMYDIITVLPQLAEDG